MLIETKVRVSRKIDGKTRKKQETYLADKEFFSQAEYFVTAVLNQEKNEGIVEEFEIQSLKISSIKELDHIFAGENTYVATLKDLWVEDGGTEKSLKYKVLLWADDLTIANQHAQALQREGYDMLIEGIKQVDYEYLTEQDNQENNG